jgi:hypothetical protein
VVEATVAARSRFEDHEAAALSQCAVQVIVRLSRLRL